MTIDIRDVQLLIFESGSECNLAEHHTKCPASLGEARYAKLDCSRPLDDHTIVETAKRFYGEFGFRGLVGFHYFNEPCLQIQRISGLAARIEKASPHARFILWTNGTLMPEAGLLWWCDVIRVTDYGGQHAPRNLQCARAACSKVVVAPAHLDARMQELGQDSDRPCQRPYTEFIIDAWGSVHLCCIDWRGLASPGNVLSEGLDKCVARWRVWASRIVSDPMDATAPEACRRCPMRFGSRSNFA